MTMRALSLFMLSAVLLMASPVHAHRVNIFAWVQGETVHGECAYPSGKPVAKGLVQVSDAALEEVLLTLSTDEQGLFSFPIPDEALAKGMDLLLTLDAGVGHQSQWTIAAAEYGATTSVPGPDQAITPASTPSPATPDLEALDALLEKKLAPIRKSLAQMAEDKVSISDIVGGLGWLIGLFGLLAWFKSRPVRMKDRDSL